MGAALGVGPSTESPGEESSDVSLVKRLVEAYEKARASKMSYVETYNVLAATLLRKERVEIVVATSNLEGATPENTDADETIATLRRVVENSDCDYTFVIRTTVPEIDDDDVKRIVVVDMMSRDEEIPGLSVVKALAGKTVVMLCELEDSSKHVLEAGATMTYTKPLSLRKARNLLVSCGAWTQRRPAGNTKVDDVRPATTTTQKDEPLLLESANGRMDATESKETIDLIWASALFDAEGHSVRLIDAVAQTTRYVLLAFIPALSCPDYAVKTKNLLNQLNFYAAALDCLNIKILGICCESREDMTKLQSELDLRFLLLSDVALTFTSTYVGVSQKNGVVSPNPGLFFLGAKDKSIRAMLLASDEGLPEAKDVYTRIFDDEYLEAAYGTVTACSGKFAGTISAINYLAALDATPRNSPWVVEPFLRNYLGGDLAAVERAVAKDVVTALRIKLNDTDAARPAIHDCALVAEDYCMSADLIVRKLLRIGHSVLYANDGRTALALLEKFHANITVVFTDVLMYVSFIFFDSSAGRTWTVLSCYRE